MTNQEVKIAVADPHNPYAMPAAMPSSADKEPRSFDLDAFPVPKRKDPDWRFTPIERMDEFFHVFQPTRTTSISVSNIDGSPVDANLVGVATIPMGQAPSGTVLRPSDRASVVEWNSAATATTVTVCGRPAQPVLIKIRGDAGPAAATGESSHDVGMDAVHLVIVVKDDAQADIVVEHGGLARIAEGIELTTGKHSRVSATFIQEWDKGSKQIGNQRIHVGEGASLRHSVVTLGGDVVRIRMDQDFGGEEGDLNMLGIYFVDPGEHIEHRTMVVHNHPHCKSRVVYKGALDGDHAHATWVGNALIQPTAPGTDSYELNRNLVLTPGAVADSEPNLEIENGDIIGAGHASSVGRFDDEELFYLQSRGIPEVEARKLVVRGFFGELIEEIGVPAITDHLMNVIDRRLARGENAAMQHVLEEK